MSYDLIYQVRHELSPWQEVQKEYYEHSIINKPMYGKLVGRRILKVVFDETITHTIGAKNDKA